MIQHQAKQGDPNQTVVITDGAGSIFAVCLFAADDGHDFAVFTNNPITPTESVAHTLLIAANDILHEAGYPNALQDAIDFALNLVVDAFRELDQAVKNGASDDLPF